MKCNSQIRAELAFQINEKIKMFIAMTRDNSKQTSAEMANRGEEIAWRY